MTKGYWLDVVVEYFHWCCSFDCVVGVIAVVVTVILLSRKSSFSEFVCISRHIFYLLVYDYSISSKHLTFT